MRPICNRGIGNLQFNAALRCGGGFGACSKAGNGQKLYNFLHGILRLFFCVVACRPARRSPAFTKARNTSASVLSLSSRASPTEGSEGGRAEGPCVCRRRPCAFSAELAGASSAV